MVSSPKSKRPALRVFPFNKEVLRDLILYIAEQCQADPTYDGVKLNTVLYYADFAAYRMFGEPITGATYRKYDAGPTAEQYFDARRELIESGDAELVDRPHFFGGSRQLIPASGGIPNQERFSPAEIELVDSIIDFFAGRSSREVSEFVRREPGWALVGRHEAIPYQSAWLQPTPFDPDSEAAAFQYAREQGYLK